MNNNETSQAQVRQETSHQEISRRAEELWRQYGCPQGRDEEIWLEAEGQLRGTASSLAAPSSEGVGALAAQAPTQSSVEPVKDKSREREMMEKEKRTAPPKSGRGKNK